MTEKKQFSLMTALQIKMLAAFNTMEKLNKIRDMSAIAECNESNVMLSFSDITEKMTQLCAPLFLLPAVSPVPGPGSPKA